MVDLTSVVIGVAGAILAGALLRLLDRWLDGPRNRARRALLDDLQLLQAVPDDLAAADRILLRERISRDLRAFVEPTRPVIPLLQYGTPLVGFSLIVPAAATLLVGGDAQQAGSVGTTVAGVVAGLILLYDLLGVVTRRLARLRA